MLAIMDRISDKPGCEVKVRLREVALELYSKREAVG